MKLSEIYAVANEIAPKSLSDEYCKTYGAYDNSGILVDTGDEVNAILFALDLSDAAIERALQIGANLIITHHPAIYGKIANVRVEDGALLGGKLIKCIKNGISVIAMHLNVDCAIDGIDESLMHGIVCAAGGTCGENATLMHTVGEGGYGRAYDVPSVTLSMLAENMKKEFNSDRIVVYGDEERQIKRAVSCCGAGADEETVRFAKQQGAQVIVSADFKHHILLLAKENGLNAVVLTHYCAEHYGFEKFYKKIRQSIALPCSLCTDDSLL